MSLHLSASINLTKNIDIYYELYGTYYLFAHSFESILINSVYPSFININLIMVLFYFISPICFYSLSNRLTKNKEKVSMFATWLFYTGLSGGISWILFYYLRFTSPEQSLYASISQTSIRSVNSLWSGFLVCFYFPTIFAFIFFILGMNILYNKNLKRNQKWLLTTIVFTLMYLTHNPEAIIFSILIFLLSFFKNFKISTRNIISGIISGCILTVVMLYSINRYTTYLHPSVERAYYFLFIISCVGIVIYIINRSLSSTVFKFSKLLNTVFRNRRLKYIFILIIYLNFIGIITWIIKFNDNDYTTINTSIFGNVPWFLYSIVLGLANIITLFFFYTKTKEKKLDPIFLVLIFFLFFFFLFARFLFIFSYITNTVFYWENRFITFILIPISIVCGYYFFDKFRTMKSKITFPQIILLFIVIFSNYNIIILNTISRYSASQKSEPMSKNSIEGLDKFRDILIDNPRALVITYTDNSKRLLRLSGASYSETISIDDLSDFYNLIYDKDIEDYSHIYFFLTSSEYSEIIDKNSPIYNILILSESILENQDFIVFNLGKLLTPNNQGFINFIIDKSNMNEEILNLLLAIASKEKLNYSVYFNSDNRIAELNKNFLLTIDPADDNSLISYEFLSDYWQTNFGYFEFNTDEILLGDNVFNLPGQAIYNYELNKTRFDFSVKLSKIYEIYNTYVITFLFFNENKTKLKVFDIIFQQNPYNELIVSFYDNETQIKDYYKTGIKWKLNESYDFCINSDNGTIDISFNDTQIYNKELGYGIYYLGIKYVRIQRAFILINNIMTDLITSHLDYDYYMRNTIKRIENNSKICVFNFNGYQKYGNNIFDLNKEIKSDKISYVNFSENKIYRLNCTFNKYIFPSKSKFTTKANYILDNGSEIPFITELKLNHNISVLYINVFPIFRQILSENDYKTFKKIPFFEEISKIIIEFFSNNGEYQNNISLNNSINNLWEGYVDSIEVSNATILPSSILLNEELFNQIERIEVKYENDTTNIFHNFEIIYWKSNGEIIKIDSGKLNPFYGNYAKLRVESQIDIAFTKGKSIRIMGENSSTINIKNVKFIRLSKNNNTNNYLTLIIKYPEIVSNFTIMNNWIPKNIYESPLKEIGKNITIEGINSYRFLSSSNKILLFDLNIEDCALTVNFDEKQQYNEIKSLLLAIEIMLFSSPILFLLFCIIELRKRRRG